MVIQKGPDYEKKAYNGLWPFSFRDYRVADHRVSGVWGVPGVIFSYFL